MDIHILSLNIIIGIVSAAIILYLGDLLIRRHRKISNIQQQLAETENKLEDERQKFVSLNAEYSHLKTDFKQNVLLDKITGLPSFKVFEDRLQQTVNQSERHQLMFAVLFLDIDDFKVINNVLGFEAGNILLKEIAERLQTCIRKVDTMCHYVSDGFTFLLPQISKPETAAYVAQRLLDVVSKPFVIMDHELFVTVSVGISTYPTDGAEPKQLLKNADIALQQAKSRGRNLYQFFHQDLYALSHRELILNSCLRGDNIYQEFVLNYQPILNAQSRAIVGMEALLRWHHPQLGLIAPQDFLRLAENNGRIGAIGEWVLRGACEQFKKWQSEGFNLSYISVNISMRQLDNTHFTYKVSQTLQELGMEPANLMLEISESMLLPKLNLVEKTLHMLKHMGVQIAIDDFGTGYLSLQHLRRFPVTCLKIDNALVQAMLLDRESEAIVKSIVGLAKSLQLESIAEGVESEKQKDHLKAAGCNVMQGYFFCRPLLAQEFSNAVVERITALV
jgi:diguanylate cyclase (GGDEF)-like protein